MFVPAQGSSISQHTKFEVPSFIDPKDMTAGQNVKYGSRDPDYAH